jgi:hypothetical protein
MSGRHIRERVHVAYQTRFESLKGLYRNPGPRHQAVRDQDAASDVGLRSRLNSQRSFTK